MILKRKERVIINFLIIIQGENEMKKILNKLFIIASLGLIAAGVIFLCVSIFDKQETTTPLAAALACILLSNLFHVIRMNMDQK